MFTSKIAIELKYFKLGSLWSCTLINMVSRKCWINRSTLKTVLRLNLFLCEEKQFLTANLCINQLRFCWAQMSYLFRVTGVVFNLLVTLFLNCSKVQAKAKETKRRIYLCFIYFWSLLVLSFSKSKWNLKTFRIVLKQEISHLTLNMSLTD